MAIKCVITGDSATGKTAFAKRYVCGEFERRHLPTVGADVFTIIHNGVTYDIWDLAGLEKNGFLKAGYFQNAKVGIIFCSLTDQESCRNVSYWYDSIVQVCGAIPIVLMCNKSDDTSHRVVQEPHNEFADSHNIPHYEVSVLTGYNVDKGFDYFQTLSG